MAPSQDGIFLFGVSFHRNSDEQIVSVFFSVFYALFFSLAFRSLVLFTPYIHSSVFPIPCSSSVYTSHLSQLHFDILIVLCLVAQETPQ